MKSREKSYDTLMQYCFNEVRQLADRASMFLIASSLLFIGFVYLPATAKMLSTVVCAIGLAASVIIYLALRVSIRGLRFWHDALRKIEEEEEGIFAYMRDAEISPNIQGWQAWEKGILSRRWNLFPNLAWLFFFLWTASLVHVWCLS